MKKIQIVKNQRIKSEIKEIEYYGEKAFMRVELRFDDECGNGHNSFGITAEIAKNESFHERACLSGGCLHDEIKEHFPEFSSLIKWHLTSTDGRMHYIANTLYHVGDRDCWGLKKGEPRSFGYFLKFGDSPITHEVSNPFLDFIEERLNAGSFQVLAVPHKDKGSANYQFSDNYTLVGYQDNSWTYAPFRLKSEAEEFAEALNTCKVEIVRKPTAFGEGKERNLDAARAAAVWPEATDEQLLSDNLKELLIERGAPLQDEFLAAMRGAGFTKGFQEVV